MSIDSSQAWARVETRLDRIDKQLGDLRTDFAAHKATSVSNAGKIDAIELANKSELELLRSGQRRLGWFALTTAVAVIGYLLKSLLESIA